MEEMAAAGARPNVVTWSCLVGAHANAMDLDSAEGVIHEMRAAGAY